MRLISLLPLLLATLALASGKDRNRGQAGRGMLVCARAATEPEWEDDCENYIATEDNSNCVDCMEACRDKKGIRINAMTCSRCIDQGCR